MCKELVKVLQLQFFKKYSGRSYSFKFSKYILSEVLGKACHIYIIWIPSHRKKHKIFEIMQFSSRKKTYRIRVSNLRSFNISDKYISPKFKIKTSLHLHAYSVWNMCSFPQYFYILYVMFIYHFPLQYMRCQLLYLKNYSYFH